MSGQEGASKIAALMTRFRNEAPSEFAGVAVEVTEDFKELTKVNHQTNSTEKMITPPSNVLKYILADGSWIAVRPSGTEPKIKFYIGVKASSQAEAEEKVASLEDAINEITNA